MENATSHERVLTCMQEWASYGHLEYFKSWSKLTTFTAQKLKEKGAWWHRHCYKKAIHTGMLRGAKQRYERELAGPNETRRKISNVAPEELPLRLTRSKTSPFSRDKCFFCDDSGSRGKALLTVSSPYVMQSKILETTVSK